MKQFLAYGTMLCALALFAGCGETPPADGGNADGATPVANPHIHICEDCGHVKGDEGKCCNKDLKKCEKCGMIEGSPACCNTEILALFEKDEHFDVCSKCGHAELGDAGCKCSDKDAKICDKCKHHEGSLLCISKCGKKPAGEPVPAPNPKKTEKKGETGG